MMRDWQGRPIVTTAQDARELVDSIGIQVLAIWELEAKIASRPEIPSFWQWVRRGFRF